MKSAIKAPWAFIVTWLRYYYAIHFLESGLNFALFDFIPHFSKAGRAGPFQVELAAIGLYQLVKYAEVLLGAMLLLNIAVPLVLILMAGISFMIIYLNLFVSPDPRQLFSGTQEVLLIGTLLIAYGGYYADYCRVNAKPFWFWDGFIGIDRPVPQRPFNSLGVTPTVSSKDYVWVVGVGILVTVLVAVVSSTLANRPIRLYDYGPPLASVVLTLITMFFLARIKPTDEASRGWVNRLGL